MPKFSITTDSSDGPERHKDVLQFADTKAATDDAQVALAEMARDALPDGKQADFGVNVEDDGGKEIYRAELSFRAKNEDEIDREGTEANADADTVAANLGGGGPRE